MQMWMRHGGAVFAMNVEYVRALVRCHMDGDLAYDCDGTASSWLNYAFEWAETAEGHDFWADQFDRLDDGGRMTSQAQLLLRDYLRLAEDAIADAAQPTPEPCDPNDLSVFDLTLGGA